MDFEISAEGHDPLHFQLTKPPTTSFLKAYVISFGGWFDDPSEFILRDAVTNEKLFTPAALKGSRRLRAEALPAGNNHFLVGHLITYLHDYRHDIIRGRREQNRNSAISSPTHQASDSRSARCLCGHQHTCILLSTPESLSSHMREYVRSLLHIYRPAWSWAFGIIFTAPSPKLQILSKPWHIVSEIVNGVHRALQRNNGGSSAQS